MTQEAEDIIRGMLLDELMKRMRSYVREKAKTQRVPEWAIVMDIFKHGKGVSQVLWEKYINID